jgi:hypothetical protein
MLDLTAVSCRGRDTHRFRNIALEHAGEDQKTRLMERGIVKGYKTLNSIGDLENRGLGNEEGTTVAPRINVWLKGTIVAMGVLTTFDYRGDLRLA